MKIQAQYKSKLIDQSHHAHLNFLVTNYRHITWLDELEQDKDYTMEIKLVKSKRSLQQNKYMWAMIRALALKTREDDMDLYVKLLESANAKFTYIWAMEETEDMLRKSFRAIKKMGARDVINTEGNLVSGFQYKLYEGSSKFTTEEMNVLLETLILWCTEENIETELMQYE